MEGMELPQALESENLILMMIKQPRRKLDMESLIILSLDSFMSVLVGLLNHESNPDVMFLVLGH